MLRIAEAREARGWTQERLAAEIHTTQQTIQRWETGQVDPKISRVEDISRALGVTMTYLLGIEEKNDDANLSTDEKELISCYRSVTNNGKRQLLVYARGIAVTYPKTDTVQKAV